jgi:hypothetical protein
MGNIEISRILLAREDIDLSIKVLVILLDLVITN